MASPFEFRDHVSSEKFEISENLFVRHVPELDVAEKLIDACFVIADDLLETLLGRSDDDHVLVDVLVDIDRSGNRVLEEREDLRLFFGREIGRLPGQGEFGEMSIPPRDRLPQSVVLGLVEIITAVDKCVGANAIVADARQRGDAFDLCFQLSGSILIDDVRHRFDGLQQSEGQEAETLSSRSHGRWSASRCQPSRWMRVLEGLRALLPSREFDEIGVPFDFF